MRSHPPPNGYNLPVHMTRRVRDLDERLASE
jgi:hypothetical protein